MILTIANQKGGSGKTTLAVSLASEWRRRGLQVLLVDADRQATAQTWSGAAAEHDHAAPSVVGIEDGRAIARQVPELAERFDRVVIDCPPGLGPALRGALGIADLAVVPMGASHQEAWALAETIEVIHEAEAVNQRLRVALVLTRLHSRRRLAHTFREQIRQQVDFPVLRSTVGDRATFVDMFAEGQGPTEYQPTSKAAEEVIALAKEIDRWHETRNGQPKRSRSASRRRKTKRSG